MKKQTKSTDLTEYTTKITGLSHEGRGIAHPDNRATFIFNALPDETIQFYYTKKCSRIAEGTATHIVHASEKRVAPKCAHFNVCGGCALQHMTPDYQRQFKLTAALQLLQQHNIVPTTLLPALCGPEWHYRRKARLGVKYVIKKNELLVGFRERNTNLIAKLDTCHILDHRLGLNLTPLKKLIDGLEIRDQIPQIEMAATDKDMALIIRHLAPLSAADLDALQQFGKQHHFKMYVQPKGIDSIKPIDESSAELSYSLAQFDLTLYFHPAQFIQINQTINPQMISQAIALLDLQPEERLLDLFCGIGNFTLPLARHAKKVVGVEADRMAVQQAKKNALHNGITNTEFYLANLFEPCDDLPWAQSSYDKIVLDPPRSGAQEIISLIPRWNPSAIAYVSCNPSTFARDAALLKQQQYSLTHFGLMDMFPHTQHAEVIGLFKR